MPLRIELRWGCQESSREKASGSGVTFKYDPFGRRIEKISPSATSIFAYDGDNLVETVNASGGEVASYAQGQHIDEPLAMDRSGTIDYYERDGLGSITSLTASTGSIAQSYTYDSFGNTTTSSGSLTNFFRYSARELDIETNLYYDRARYYDSNAGRFASEDPSGFYGWDVNLYRYVWDDPLNFVDPVGEWGVGATLGGSIEGAPAGGAIPGSAGATGSLGAGVFLDGTHPSVGGFRSGGAFAAVPGWGVAYPRCPNMKNGALGGFVGGGLNVFATNANNVRDLSGPFKTYSLNVGWGARVLSIQFAIGTNEAGRTIGVLSYGGPMGLPFPTGVGFGGSLSRYNTNTRTTAGGGECPCH